MHLGFNPKLIILAAAETSLPKKLKADKTFVSCLDKSTNDDFVNQCTRRYNPGYAAKLIDFAGEKAK